MTGVSISFIPGSIFKYFFQSIANISFKVNNTISKLIMQSTGSILLFVDRPWRDIRNFITTQLCPAK